MGPAAPTQATAPGPAESIPLVAGAAAERRNKQTQPNQNEKARLENAVHKMTQVYSQNYAPRPMQNARCTVLYIQYCILYALYCILYALYCMLFSPQPASWWIHPLGGGGAARRQGKQTQTSRNGAQRNGQSILYGPYFLHYTMQYARCTILYTQLSQHHIHYVLYCMHCILYTTVYALCIYVLCTVLSALYFMHYTSLHSITEFYTLYTLYTVVYALYSTR